MDISDVKTDNEIQNAIITLFLVAYKSDKVHAKIILESLSEYCQDKESCENNG